MLGRTNLLFVAGDNTSELAFTPDYILTSASGNILKIEYINDLFFVFTEDEKVLYGSDMNNLQTLKNGNEAFAAKHIIYADGVYYLTKIEKTTSKAIIYKSSDLISYEVITLKTGTSSYSYPVHGLFLDSKGEIVALIEEYKDTYSSHNRYLLIVDTLEGYQEESASFIEVTPAPYNKNTTAIGTRLKKDRIFTYINASSSYDDGGRMISLDGTMSSVDMYSFFALDYFFKLQSHSPSRLYYSLNGTDYISLEFSNDVTDFNAINVFEYGGTIALIYRCTENEETVTKLTTAATPKELIKATASAIPVTIDYGMIANSNVYVDEYAYLGSTGGIVIKGKIDNAETERPDVVVVKGMAAKEALKQANDYTDEKYKNITKEVELHEETTRQYMENAFSATPEGYAALVDTVSENKVKIDTIIEKADLGIKADASGEEIHLTDSDDDMVPEFHMFGKIEQNTTQGKNLIDISAIVSNYKLPKALPAGTYTVSFLAPESVGGAFRMSNSTDTSVDSVVASGGKNADGYTVLKLTTTFVTNYVNLSCGTSTIVHDVMLTEGTEYVPYEPYSGGMPSPNPQYQQHIEVSGASGSVAVECLGGNNRFNYKEVAETWYKKSGSNVYRKVYSLKPNTPYTLSCGVEVVQNGINYAFCFIVSGNDLDFAPTTSANGVSKGKSRTVVTDSNGNLVVGTYLVSDIDSNITIDIAKIQLEEGDVATPYTEYIGLSSATIPTENGLAGIKVSENGNYTDQNGQQWICDEIVKYADGSGEKIQRVGKAVFDGSEDEKWSTSGTSQDGKRRMASEFLKSLKETAPKTPNASSEVINALCSMFVVMKSNTQGTFGCNNGCSVIPSGTLYVYSDMYNTNDVTLWTSYLAENPMEFYYELETPIHTPLTAEEIAEIEKLQTFYPITNISNDADCGMSVKYHADSKNYIDRMVAEQVASIVANMNN